VDARSAGAEARRRRCGRRRHRARADDRHRAGGRLQAGRRGDRRADARRRLGGTVKKVAAQKGGTVDQGAELVVVEPKKAEAKS
jgi:acetyl/propionyl-CoA carboxylase alpha subunit